MIIAISTIVDYGNYGNRLQNYALQEILLSKDVDVQTIRNLYFQNDVKDDSIFSKVRNSVREKELKKKIMYRINRKKNQKNDEKREMFFKDFTKKFIKETDFIYDSLVDKCSWSDSFDCYVIGSDQVWNYNFHRFSMFDFLTFTDKYTFSYAASFGVDEIPESYKLMYMEGLSSLDMISVRENKGKEIVESLTDKKATVVLDPTLMLSKNEWLELCKENPTYNKPYILTYFLDKPTKETRKYYERIAKEKGYEIKRLADRSDKELWVADPAEFVNLFSQAEAVFTDSFHACVFSIIFEKYFEVFERNTSLPSMNSRIDTLFELLDLKDRWHEGNNGILEINYDNSRFLLEKAKKESSKFLDNALKAAREDLDKGE